MTGLRQQGPGGPPGSPPGGPPGGPPAGDRWPEGTGGGESPTWELEAV